AFNSVEKQVSKYPEVLSVEFGGSYAKGTWISEIADIDIFLKFKKSTSEKKFSTVAKKIGFDSMKKFKPYVRFSEHPYVEAHIEGTRVNVVPCYDVTKGEWQSAADRSSFHTRFMLESLSGQMKDDVRLLKQFLKSNSVYGAEIAKQGFSGYAAEVLVWNFGSFENVIKKIAKLKQNQVIGKASKKFDTLLVIMDPIDDKRNLAAAISTENIGKFVLVCRAFLKKPSLSFFKSRSSTKKNLKDVIVIEFNYSARSPDIIWGQIKRAANALATQMEIEGFKVLRNGAATDEKKEAALFFVSQALEIEKNMVREGPGFFSETDSEKFITKNFKKGKIMWIDNKGRILSLQKRKNNNAKTFLNDLLKNNLDKSGVPKGLKADFKKGFKIIPGDKVSNKSIKEVLIGLVTTDETIFFTN
ncbi:MAG: CCA tRNA nucleotidyltransferase, partial [Thaumarchaeota archaeon]|nr:CCA tRNA nucleotidyltransferase [Nitrososphaerota archaeon]